MSLIRISQHRIPTRKNRVITVLIHYIVKAIYIIFSILIGNSRRNAFLPYNNKVKKILLIRLDFLGDITISTPAFKGLREIFSDSHITLLAANMSKELVEVMPYFNEIKYYDAPWYFKNSNYRIRNLLETIKDLRRDNYDMVIDLRGDFRNNIFMFLLKIKYRIGFDITGCDFLLTNVITCDTNHHGVSLCINLLNFFSPNYRAEPKPFLPITEHDRLRTNALFQDLLIEEYNNCNPNIIIHPGASWHGRHWKPEYFAKVADLLIKKNNANIIITGGILDIEIAEKIYRKMSHKAIMLAGRLSLREFIALIEIGDVFLGLDSGPMHMASSTDIKIVALFGPAYQESVGPLGSEHIVITHQNDFPCSPCSQTKCKRPHSTCMDSILVDEVYNAVFSHIKELSD